MLFSFLFHNGQDPFSCLEFCDDLYAAVRLSDHILRKGKKRSVTTEKSPRYFSYHGLRGQNKRYLMRFSCIISTTFTMNNRKRNAVMYGCLEIANSIIAAAYSAMEQGL